MGSLASAKRSCAGESHAQSTSAPIISEPSELEAPSAGMAADAHGVMTRMLEWADLIFTMGVQQRGSLGAAVLDIQARHAACQTTADPPCRES